MSEQKYAVNQPYPGQPGQYPGPPGQYPGQPGQYPGQYTQQPATVVVVPQVVQPLAPQPAGCCACCIVPSYCGLIALSCFVFWCCGWVFGLIAFILALVGQNQEATGQVLGGRGLAKASFWVSIAGVIVGSILLVIVIILYATAFSYVKKHCYYSNRGEWICN